MSVQPIPTGYHTITPYLIVDGVAKLLEFLEKAFDAKVDFRFTTPDGVINHASVRIGNSMIMMGQSKGEHKPVAVSFYMYVPDVDAAYRKAAAAGGVPITEPANMPYGDRHGGIADPAGNTWWIATHIEDVSEEELGRRFSQASKNGS